MASNRCLWLALTIAASFPVACKDKPADSVADSAAPAVATTVAPTTTHLADAAADAGEDGGRRHAGRGMRDGRGGPSAMLFEAARGLDLKDGQKTKVDAADRIAQTAPSADARDAMKAASKELHTELAAGVKSGKIDTAKLESRYVVIEKAAKERQSKEADGLAALHGALESAQRKLVVANVRAKQVVREERAAHHRKDRMERLDAGDAKTASSMAKQRLDRLTHNLELTADQQKKVAALLPKEDGKTFDHAAEGKKRLDAMLTAFEAETFDAKKAFPQDTKNARGPMADETKLLAQLVPILTPEQREKLASSMTERSGGAFGRHGGGTGGGHHADGDDDDDDDDDDDKKKK